MCHPLLLLLFLGWTSLFPKLSKIHSLLFLNLTSMQSIMSTFLQLGRISRILLDPSYHFLLPKTSCLLLRYLSWITPTLIDLPNCLLDILQQVHNNATHIVFHWWKADHTTPLLHEHHWLPVELALITTIDHDIVVLKAYLSIPVWATDALPLKLVYLVCLCCPPNYATH